MKNTKNDLNHPSRRLPFHQTNSLNRPNAFAISSRTQDGSTADVQLSMERELEDLIAQNRQLDHKITTNTLSFNNVLIYCKKTIENQDEQIKRLDDIISRNEAIYEEKLRNDRLRAQEDFEELKLSLTRLNNENLLMKTQLGNQDQMELEMKELNQKIEQLKHELEIKTEKAGKRELKERELIILTTERVRRELEAEFAEELTKVQKELRIQNLAQIEANQQIVKKVQLSLEKKEREKEALSQKTLKSQNELDQCKLTLQQCENEKKRYENIAQRSRQQAEKMLRDSKLQLENIEKTRAKEAMRQAEIIEDLKKQDIELRRDLQNVKKDLDEYRTKFEFEKKQREQTIERHSDQNAKLNELREFLKYILEDNSDGYIDT